jgi:hypothetical protein
VCHHSLQIEKTLKLTKNDIYNSNIAAVAATVAARFAVGPCIDTFGPRVTFAALLVAGKLLLPVRRLVTKCATVQLLVDNLTTAAYAALPYHNCQSAVTLNEALYYACCVCGLITGSIPSFFSGLVQTANDLAIVRFFIGTLGACFVCNQAWSSQVFAKVCRCLFVSASHVFESFATAISHQTLYSVLFYYVHTCYEQCAFE